MCAYSQVHSLRCLADNQFISAEYSCARQFVLFAIFLMVHLIKGND